MYICTCFLSFPILSFFKKSLFYLFLDRGEGRDKERERNLNVWLPLMHPQLGTWPATQACALTGSQTSDPLVHRPALNSLSHTSQGSFPFLLFFNKKWHPLYTNVPGLVFPNPVSWRSLHISTEVLSRHFYRLGVLNYRRPHTYATSHSWTHELFPTVCNYK